MQHTMYVVAGINLAIEKSLCRNAPLDDSFASGGCGEVPRQLRLILTAGGHAKMFRFSQ